MKLKDVQDIFDAGLISDEQRARIVEHFHLEHPRSRFLTILSLLGGALLLCGVILVISTNWDDIPAWFKIVAGAGLMVGAHFGGWRLRGSHPKVSEALHFFGAGLFLANIALVGQIYHLSSRTPNSLLLWLAGIIPLVWILRSAAIQALVLAGSLVWIGTEINANDGWFHFASHFGQCAVYAATGLLFYSWGLLLKRGSFGTVGAVTERFGMIVLHLSLWPMVPGDSDNRATVDLFLMAPPAVLGLALLASEMRLQKELSAQWRNAWLAVLAGWIGFAALWMVMDFGDSISLGNMGLAQALISLFLIAGSIVQIRLAEELRSPWMVNLAIVTIGYTVIVTFVLLIGSMMNTGLIFLVGGAGLLGLGYWLEKKRRAVIRRMHA